MKKLSPWAAVFLSCIFCALSTRNSRAQTFTSLASFDGTNGAAPWYPMSLIQATNGNFYGTTAAGGANDSCVLFYQVEGCGTVFEVTPGGKLTTLHSFAGADGEEPTGGLVQATNGAFYGTTSAGGAYGGGTIFKITPGGTLTTLYDFCSQTGCADGDSPIGGLIQATNGNLYGTTFAGGANNDGTVFEITLAGKLTTLQSFDGTDGEGPIAALLQGTNGNFYGTTAYGGAYGDGTIFEITPARTLAPLYSFCAQGGYDCPDGWGPYAGLVQATNGDLYGETFGGGAYDQGTVFKIGVSGTFTTVLDFDFSDGAIPYTRLVQATDRNFYGTTGYGGAYDNCTNNCGTVFKLTPGGTLSTLESFDSADGANPFGGLIQSTDGEFYGTTGFGGTSSNCTGGCGTVFSVSVGLLPFVETNPTSGKVGAAVAILGNNLTGSTSVTFNGTQVRSFKASNTEITTAVPSGATTGYVKVTTASGKILTSNVKFRVP